MPIIPFSNSSSRSDLFVTVDKMQRLCLSIALRRELNCETSAIDLYVGYDPVNKRIGLGKPNVVKLVDTKPFKFDAGRGYARANNFLSANVIPADGSRYYYEGRDNDGYLTFKLDGYDAPDQTAAVKAQAAEIQSSSKRRGSDKNA